MNRIERLQARLEAVTARWWFFVLILLLQVVPPYTTVRFDPSRVGDVIQGILSRAFFDSPPIRAMYVPSKVLAMVMLLGIVVFRGRWSRLFSAYAALSYAVFAVVQNVAYTHERGLEIVTNNVVMFLLVSSTWLLDAVVGKTELHQRINPWRLWVVPLAALAFWYPYMLVGGKTPHLSPIYIVTSPAALAFCLMTPVFLTVLILFYPRVNLVTLRTTSIVGLLLGYYNLAFRDWSRCWWDGVLRIPLFAISLYAVILAYRGVRKRQ